MIESGLGRRRLASLTVGECDRFLRQAAAGDFGRALGERYLRGVRRTLINVVQNEMRLGSVARNVADLAMTPSSTKTAKDMRALTVDELRALLDVATDGRLIIVDFCGRNGRRPAEARAVRWADLDQGELTISGQMNRRNQRTGPKTKIAIDPAISPYELRHTAISIQADAGHSSWEIADWAGTSEAMISGVYRHRLKRVSTLQPVDASRTTRPIRSWAHSRHQGGDKRAKLLIHHQLRAGNPLLDEDTRPSSTTNVKGRLSSPPCCQAASQNHSFGL